MIEEQLKLMIDSFLDYYGGGLKYELLLEELVIELDDDTSPITFNDVDSEALDGIVLGVVKENFSILEYKTKEGLDKKFVYYKQGN